MPRHLHIDPFSGIAGDMFLGALIDLGVALNDVRDALAKLPIDEPYTLTADRVSRHGIGAVDLRVSVSATPPEISPEVAQKRREEHGHGHGHEHEHDHHHTHEHSHAHPHEHEHSAETRIVAPPEVAPPEVAQKRREKHSHHHTGCAEILAMVEMLDLSQRGQARAKRVVLALAEAEARVHGTTVEQVHFHEVGAVDSIVDMLGSVVALERLEVATVSCGPLPISRGMVRCEHGLMPVPAPATAYLLRGMVTVGVERTGELVTPTGAALVAGLCESFGPPPAMVMRGIGYGAGDREDPHVPNLLRLMLGETVAEKSEARNTKSETNAKSKTPRRQGAKTPRKGKTAKRQ